MSVTDNIQTLLSFDLITFKSLGKIISAHTENLSLMTAIINTVIYYLLNTLLNPKRNVV